MQLLGKMGGRLSEHSKWDMQAFMSDGFIRRVVEDKLVLDYDGMEHGMSEVPVEHVRWFARLTSQLTHAQLRAGFEAAGATRVESNGFSRPLMDKIAALRRATDVPQTTRRMP